MTLKNNPTNHLTEEYHTTHSHRMDVDETDNIHITEHWETYVQLLMQWKSNQYYIIWLCTWRLSYPACNVHAPCCRLWPAWLYSIFPHHLTKTQFLEKEISLLKIKYAFSIYLKLLYEIFLILWRNEREIIKNVYRSSHKVSIILVWY